MKASHLVPALIVPIIAWRFYARARRNIGRQRLRRGALRARVIMLSLGSALIVGATAYEYLPSLLGFLGGAAAGVLLGFLGLRLTRFETEAGEDFYTPNTYLGVGLTLLLVGRIGYRFVILLTAPEFEPPPTPLFHSPLTLLVFGLTVGYYIVYCAGVLVRSGKSPAKP